MDSTGSTCQSCRQPLLADALLSTIQESNYDLLAGSVPALPPPSTLSRLDRLAQIPAPSSSVAKEAYLAATASAASAGPSASAAQRRGGGTGPAESFVLLSNSAVLSPSSSASFARRPSSPSSSSAADRPAKHALSTQLLQLVSARTDTDHPLCAECARLLQDVLADQLAEVGRERDAYIAFEKRVRDLPGGGRRSDAEMRALEGRLRELTTDETAARQELLQLEAESQALSAELAALARESAAVASAERAFLRAHAHAVARNADLEVRAAAVQDQYARDLRELERLEGANVWVDVFCIGSVDLRKEGGGGKVGSINGLRLGKGSKANPVDWPEINAAWGLACFCLHALAKKANFSFRGYTLLPLGSMSKIEDTEANATYELFGSSDAFSRFLFNKRYENGMVAFLECLRQLLEHARASEDERVRREGGKPWEFGRYHIVKDKIGEPGREISIKAGYTPSSSSSSTSSSLLAASVLGGGGGASASAGEDGWSRACRYTLLTLHRLIGWATRG